MEGWLEEVKGRLKYSMPGMEGWLKYRNVRIEGVCHELKLESVAGVCQEMEGG